MDIIGFDAQINAPRNIRKITRKVQANVQRRISPQVQSVQRRVSPAQMPSIKRRIQTAQIPTVQRRLSPAQVPSAQRRILSAQVPSVQRRILPAQVPSVINKKTSSNIKPTSFKANKAPMAIVKKSGRVIPLKTLLKTRNPNLVMSVSPIQRSYMPVDLPYQKITSKSKFVRIINTPFSYAVNIDMIEPKVDSGISNYYGK